MLKINLVVLLALFVTACNPIPQLPQNLTRCSTGSLVMLPGQSAEGWVSDELPNYVDIVGASSELDGETLTAVFHLRGIPQRLEFNRKGVPNNRIEYMWVVAINTDGDPNLTLNQFDYWLQASYAANRFTENSRGIMRDVSAALRGGVLKFNPKSDEQTQLMDPLEQNVDLVISHQDNTLTLVGHVPGITSNSTITFSAHDDLLGRDFVQCIPG